MNKENLKNKIKYISPILGSITLFLLFFLYGIINNLSFSYMGNTNEGAVKFLIDHFLSTIIMFILKLFFIYILLGIIFGFISLLIINTIFRDIIRRKNISFKSAILLNGILSLFLYMPFFLKDLIYYPQVYNSGFYVKNSFNSWLMIFLADKINPIFFTVLQGLFLAIILALLIYGLIKSQMWRYFNNIKIYGIAAAIILVVVIFLISENFGKKFNSGGNDPNIIILSSDGLRPDRLSGFGYSKQTSPNIDKLIQEGVSFTDAHVEGQRTFSSWVSFMTGQFAATHGVRHMFPASMDINKDFHTLPGILNSKGYYTSVVADCAGEIFTRIDLKFKDVDAPYLNTNDILYQAILDSHVFILPFVTSSFGLKIFPVMMNSVYFCPTDLLKDRVIKSIERAKGKPFFITSFFSSTHFPYSQVYPYYKTFTDPDYKGPFKFLKQLIISTDKPESETISEKDKFQVGALYDGGIKAFDDAVGELIEYMNKKDLIKNTIIIVVTDHGENLYEGNLGMSHGEHLRGSYTTRIPFIISGKNITKKNLRIHNTVRQVDFVPTILDMLKLEGGENMDGVSLMPLIEGKGELKLYAYGETGIWFDNNQKSGPFYQKQRIIYPDIVGLSVVDFNFNNQIVLNEDYRDIINLAKHRYIYDGRYKLIYIPLSDRVIYEMYDTKNDPENTANIANIDKSNFNRLKGELFKWITRSGDVIIKDEFVFPKTRY